MVPPPCPRHFHTRAWLLTIPRSRTDPDPRRRAVPRPADRRGRARVRPDLHDPQLLAELLRLAQLGVHVEGRGDRQCLRANARFRPTLGSICPLSFKSVWPSTGRWCCVVLFCSYHIALSCAYEYIADKHVAEIQDVRTVLTVSHGDSEWYCRRGCRRQSHVPDRMYHRRRVDMLTAEGNCHCRAIAPAPEADRLATLHHHRGTEEWWQRKRWRRRCMR